jgi:hypothetical protein
LQRPLTMADVEFMIVPSRSTRSAFTATPPT